MLKHIYDSSPILWKKLMGYIYTLGYNSNGLNIFKTLKTYLFLQRSQWWSKEKLEKYQLFRLKHLLEYSYRNVPYYRNLFKKLNIKIENINSFEDFKKLPILTKEEVIKNFDKLISILYLNKKDLILRTTGGTTGKFLYLFLDPNAQILFNACKIRSFTLAGVKNHHKKINFGSTSFPYPKNRDYRFGIYNHLERSLDFSSRHISLKVLENYTNQIIKFEPKFIRGFSSAIYVLALFLKERNINLNLKAVITKSENLFNFQKKIISEQFGCDVFDYYGLNEDVCSAMECREHNGLHTDMEKGIIEVIKNNNQLEAGKKGLIIATSLHNYVTPLIRYETGDIGSVSKKECGCGRGLRLLDSVEGRFSDIMVLNDDIMISPTEFSAVVRNVNHIKECQFIQLSKNEILVKITRRKEFTNKDYRILIQNLHQLLGTDIKSSLKFVDFIKREKNGKFKLVVSKFNPEKIKYLI